MLHPGRRERAARGCPDAASGGTSIVAGEVLADVELQQDMRDELDWDPVVRVTDIGVAVHDGVATLTGLVRSLGERREAEDTAQRAHGVTQVINQLRVQ
jgi:osmotically-inducible protein OsmY